MKIVTMSKSSLDLASGKGVDFQKMKQLKKHKKALNFKRTHLTDQELDSDDEKDPDEEHNDSESDGDKEAENEEVLYEILIAGWLL